MVISGEPSREGCFVTFPSLSMSTRACTSRTEVGRVCVLATPSPVTLVTTVISTAAVAGGIR